MPWFRRGRPHLEACEKPGMARGAAATGLLRLVLSGSCAFGLQQDAIITGGQTTPLPVTATLHAAGEAPFVVSLISPPPPAASTVTYHCSTGSSLTTVSDCYEYDKRQYPTHNFDCNVVDRVYADFGSFCASWVSNNFTYNGGSGPCNRVAARRVSKVDCIGNVRTETILQLAPPALAPPPPLLSPPAPAPASTAPPTPTPRAPTAELARTLYTFSICSTLCDIPRVRCI